MGTRRDMKRRLRRMRKDDSILRREVDDARVLIFQSGISVDGTRVKDILNGKSLAPTRVSVSYCCCSN
jgi:hypothetical protein